MPVRSVQSIDRPRQRPLVRLSQEGKKLYKGFAVQSLPLSFFPVMARPILQQLIVQKPGGAADILYSGYLLLCGIDAVFIRQLGHVATFFLA